jgi:hypothetical protein
MSSIGRELKMRLMVLSTSSRVKDLGIEGRGAALDNFVRVDIDRDRRAILSDGIRQITVPTTEIVGQAGRAKLRPWRGALEPEPAPADNLLADLLAKLPPSQQSVTLHDGGRQIVVNVSQQATMPATVRPRRRSNGIDIAGRRARAEKLRQVRRLVAEGRSANEIDRMLPGERSQILALVRQVKRGTGSQ